MTMDLGSVIIPHLVSYRTVTFSGQQLVKGRYERGTQTVTYKSLAIFPLTAREVQSYPQGQVTMEDIKIYELGGPTLVIGCLLTYDGKTFEVMAVSNRQKDGGFSTYLGKKKDDNAIPD